MRKATLITRVIFEGILKEEEEHHDFFISVLEDNEFPVKGLIGI